MENEESAALSKAIRELADRVERAPELWITVLYMLVPAPPTPAKKQSPGAVDTEAVLRLSTALSRAILSGAQAAVDKLAASLKEGLALKLYTPEFFREIK